MSVKCPLCKSVTYCDVECLKKDAKFHEGKICEELREDYKSSLLRKKQTLPKQATASAKAEPQRIASSQTSDNAQVPAKRKSARALVSKKARESTSTQTEEEEAVTSEHEQSPEKAPQIAEKPNQRTSTQNEDTYCEAKTASQASESSKKPRESPVKTPK